MLLIVVIYTVLFTSTPTEAATKQVLEVGEVSSMGDQAIVPITIRNMQYVTSLQYTISLSSEDSAAVTLASFTASDEVDEAAFKTTGTITNNDIIIDFTSQTGTDQRIKDKAVVIGYLTYDLSEQFSPNQAVSLGITNVVAKGKRGADLKIMPLDGKITNKMPAGDVIGSNQVTAAGAMRVLQHLNGNVITDRDQFLSADVDADGVLTKTDATQILDYATGNLETFFAVAAKELDNAVLGSEYAENIEVRHGRGPYQFQKKSGSLPRGIKLDKTTGALTGKPTKLGSYTFTVQVTDVNGYKATRGFTVHVIDSVILSVEKINPIEVKIGETPKLPKTVQVTYKDQTTGIAEVTWQAVDTSMVGRVTARGSSGPAFIEGFTITAPIEVRRNARVELQVDEVRAAYENWQHGMVIAKVSSLSREWQVKQHNLGSSISVTWDQQTTSLKIVNVASDHSGAYTGTVVLTVSDDENSKDYSVEIPVVIE